MIQINKEVNAIVADLELKRKFRRN